MDDSVGGLVEEWADGLLGKGAAKQRGEAGLAVDEANGHAGEPAEGDDRAHRRAASSTQVV
ncbi:hypothetical protein ACH4UM_22480 [Streptomyces sp. NPDC020801]|uniref:hypothetical protein n=1 Tax=unclassified Streptomyces TaxID=2593676 RepID=UPI0037BCC17F